MAYGRILAFAAAAALLTTTSAEAPGKRAVTSTCGGTMSGNCATGIFSSEIAPAITITTAITIASRGRSIAVFTT